MKYVFAIFGVVAICVGMFVFRDKKSDDDYVRIHVTANSSSQADEEVKYFVKDVVVEFLSEKLENAKTQSEALDILGQNIFLLKKIVDQTLLEEGFDYDCQIFVDQESIPTRKYDDIVIGSGDFKTLNIDLGRAEGENWWCLVYPTVCFAKNLQNCVYISKIWEIINSVTRK